MDDDDFFEDEDDYYDDGPDYDDEDDEVVEVKEEYGILTDEEKAVVTKNLLAAAVEMGDKARGVCKYGFSDREGTFNLAHDACISQLSYPLGRYGEGRQHKVGGIINWAYKGVPDELIQYVSDPDASPWRALIQKGFTLYSTPSGKTHAFIMTDLEHPGPHFGSFMKVFRTYSEKPACGALATALIKRGVHPGLVLFLTQSFYTMDGKSVSQIMAGGWHGSFLYNNRGTGLKALKNFIAGIHKYELYRNNQPWRINHSYSGCDSIFIEDINEPSYAEYLKAKYSDLLVKKTVKGAFSTVEVGGWTIDTLTDICFKEMAEHGFNYDYNQDQ